MNSLGFLRRTAGAAGFVAFATALAMPATATAGPFSGLQGEWSGSGTVQIADGGNERIRCRATYVVASDGNNLKQALRCASDSYKFDLSTNVRAQGTTLSGDWSETNRNLNGTIEGRAGNGEFQALVSANGFAASLHMSAKGNRQTITMNSKNTDLQGVQITLNR
jgi:hypothetical protein